MVYSASKLHVSAIGADLPEAGDYLVDESRLLSDPDWDAFVESTPGGHHAQTSLWAQVKRSLGWDAVRVVAREGDRIVGGVQLLTRHVGRFGAVAFAPRGPLLASHDSRVLDAVLDAVMQFGRAEGIRYIKLQPPVDRPDLVVALEKRGWVASGVEAAPSASVRVRLDRSEDEILAGMRRSTRRGARQAIDRGLRIRVGAEDDIQQLYAMIASTAERQEFHAYPLRYYEAMWRVFAERERALLLIGELDGEVLAAHLYLAFNDCVTAKAGGWSGRKTSVRPNAAMDWTAMRWGRDLGMQSFDFDGISMSVAKALATGEPLAESDRSGVSEYKLGFGGTVMLFPSAVDNSPSRALRPAVQLVAPRLGAVRNAAHRVLGRGA